MTPPCGCRIVLQSNVTIVHGDEGSDIYEIAFCPKHAAVDSLVEAAKKVAHSIRLSEVKESYLDWVITLENAIQQAEKKE